MNQLYPLIESVINQGSEANLTQIITFLNEKPGELSQEYGCGSNFFYILRRLMAAALARDHKIKDNTLHALQSIKQQLQQQIQLLKNKQLGQFFLTVTNLKQCKAKQQTAAYIQGKFNIIKVLIQNFRDNEQIISHFIQIFNSQTPASNDQHQIVQKQQIIQILYILTQNKQKRQAIYDKLKLGQYDGTGLVFYSKLLLENQTPSEKTKTKKAKPSLSLDQTIISKIIEESIANNYPKQSLPLKYIGLNLKKLIHTSTPQEWFKSHYNQYLASNEDLEAEDGNIKRLFYLLEVQKYFLQSQSINPKNIKQSLCVQMFIIWLQQLRVKNKHMRQIAGSIKISFDLQDNSEFALEVIKYLHTEKKIYLENISSNHPLAQLYLNADATKLWQYFVEIIKKEQNKQQKDNQDMQEQQQQRNRGQQYLSELQYITRQRSQDLSVEQVSQTLIILIKAYQKSKGMEKLLNLVWSLFHHVTDSTHQVKQKKIIKNKKKIILNKKGALILSKMKLNDLEIQAQIVQILTKAIKFIRIQIKNNSQTENKIHITFYNFITALLIYCIVYPQQADVCAEIQFISKDLQAFLNKDNTSNEGKDTLKKKVKKNKQSEQDPKKSIHVLIDVFISLLTKAPIFLRNAINLLFEQLLPHIQTSDLDTLLDVIMKPDQEYIQEI